MNGSARGFTALTALLCVVGIAWAYAPVASYGFVGYDDGQYVSANPVVAGGLDADAVRWAFGNHAANFHPLTWLSHMLDVELFGLDAGAHHLVSVGLHALNALLCLLVLRELGLRPESAALVAVLFALHPLRVESVAWIAERKDVLAGTFFFTTLWTWARYVRAPSAGRMAVVATSFALGLLAKPMLVSLPLVLLCLDRWPLGRLAAGLGRGWKPLLVEKTPLILLAAASCWMTVQAQSQGGALQSFERIPLAARLSHAPLALLGYLRRFFWPADLAVFYPHPALVETSATPALVTAVAALTIVAITVGVWAVRRREGAALCGWSWTLVMMLPVIGIVQVGSQALADRYTYLPLVGFSLLVAVPLGRVLPTRIERGLALALALVLALATRAQVQVWRDTTTLFEHAVAVTQANPVAHANLGTALAEEGRLEEAETHLLRSMRLAPHHPQPAVTYASVRALRGDLEGARASLQAALRAAPDFAPAHLSLGGVLSLQGRPDEAARAYERALELQPENATAHLELGQLREELGDRARALAHYRAALAADPRLLEAGLSLAWLVATTPSSGAERAEGLAWARRACEASQTRDADALDVWAAALAANGSFDDAARVQEQALAVALEAGDTAGEASRRAWLSRYRNGQGLAPDLAGKEQ